jgi:hypothetical protein
VNAVGLDVDEIVDRVDGPARRQKTAVVAKALPVTVRLSAGPSDVWRKTSLAKTIGARTKTFLTH